LATQQQHPQPLQSLLLSWHCQQLARQKLLQHKLFACGVAVAAADDDEAPAVLMSCC
jgi:hypothetical protein